MKKLSVLALVAGIVAWAVTRGKKQEPEAEAEYSYEVPVAAGVSDTGPSEG